MSLSDCIKKAGKALNKKDVDSILSKRDQLVANGMDEANAESIALRQAEDSIQVEMDDILLKSGVSASKDIPRGVDIEIDGKSYDSNQFINDVDSELDAMDSILGCLYR